SARPARSVQSPVRAADIREEEEELGLGSADVTPRGERAEVVWHPRAATRPRRGSRDAPDPPETRAVVRGVASGLALILPLEFHIHTLRVPAPAATYAERALRGSAVEVARSSYRALVGRPATPQPERAATK